ncbi:hypothetical protein L1987_72349 [Smallanthus sonchifolius]|uniref:Uncharacterized protein n=1 Tax=Smallanthus sonchifolius TaxID=185202 RepID=A0ACB9AWN1_9ASTR|nr:hypothetical protein L1987_72349 [Smallanthus sonchifolius]
MLTLKLIDPKKPLSQFAQLSICHKSSSRLHLSRNLIDESSISNPSITSDWDKDGLLMIAKEALQIPTIAVIEGATLGGGLEMASSCDLRIYDRRRDGDRSDEMQKQDGSQFGDLDGDRSQFGDLGILTSIQRWTFRGLRSTEKDVSIICKIRHVFFALVLQCFRRRCNEVTLPLHTNQNKQEADEAFEGLIDDQDKVFAATLILTSAKLLFNFYLFLDKFFKSLVFN